MRESESWRPNILPLLCRIEPQSSKFQDSLALPFEQVLPERVIQTVLEEQGVNYRQTLYTPVVWAWMSQVLDSDKSLSNAVIAAWCSRRGGSPADTGATAKPATACPVETLVQANCRSPTSGGEAEQRWCGRRVKAYDSTTVTMSDSANQASYPQHSNQLVGWSVGKSGFV